MKKQAPKRKREPSRRRRLTKRAVVVATAVTLIVGVVGAAAVWKLQGNIETSPLGDSIVKSATPKGATNILFIGSDSRELGSSEYGKDDGTQRSDALMLVHFSKGNSRIDAVQIPRDTLTDLPACEDTGSGSFPGGPSLMINSALAGGPACSVRAVEQLSNVRVDHFVQLDFDGFASMVDALGGVNVCLVEPMVDVDAKLDLPSGKQKLDGTDALALARTRKAVGDGSDIGRLGHQQVVMSSIIEEARNTNVLTRPDRLFKFLNALTKAMTVDDGISSISGLTGLARRATAVPDDGITFATMPNTAAPTDPNRVVKTPGADTIFTAIANDQEMPVESSEAETSSADKQAPVTIVNAAATEGLATAAQTSLADLGYTVNGLETGAETAAVTRILVDDTDEAMKTAKSLNKDFGFKAEIVQQAGITGVQLELGSDRIEAGTDPVKPEKVEATTRKASDSLCA